MIVLLFGSLTESLAIVQILLTLSFLEKLFNSFSSRICLVVSSWKKFKMTLIERVTNKHIIGEVY